jgi:hypothetical protein
MNFKIVTNSRFTADIDFYKRTYYVLQKSNGLIKISNVLSGKILFDNLNPADITIDGILMTHIDELQNVVYNNEDEDFKIFDKTFDKTFE